MKHIAVGQRERTTVVTRSQIDKIYTDGFKDGVRKMQERLKKAFNFGHTILEKSICDIINQIAKEMLEEGGEG